MIDGESLSYWQPVRYASPVIDKIYLANIDLVSADEITVPAARIDIRKCLTSHWIEQFQGLE